MTGCTGPSPLARPCADHGRPPVVLVLPQHDGEEAHARQRAHGGRAPRAVTATDGGDCLRGKGGQRKRGDDCPAVVSMNKMSLGKRAGRRRLLAPLFFRLLCLRRLLRLLYADLRELKEVTWAANGGARTRRPAYSMYITTNRLYYVKAPPVVNEHKHVNSLWDLWSRMSLRTNLTYSRFHSRDTHSRFTLPSKLACLLPAVSR